MKDVTKVWLRIYTVADIEANHYNFPDYEKFDFWKARNRNLNEEELIVAYNQTAHLVPEFSTITWVAIAVDNDKVETIYWNEQTVLSTLDSILESIQLWSADKDIVLCWWNLYNFDLPFLWKRMMIKWIRPNSLLRIAQIKSREINNYIRDVNKVWKQTANWAELPLLIYDILNEKAEGDPYWPLNFDWMLQKTRELWIYFENVFARKIEVKKPNN